MQETILDNMRKNWFIIIFFGSLIAGWTTVHVDIDNLKEQDRAIMERQREYAVQFGQIAEKFGEVTNSLTRIETKLESLNEYLKDEVDISFQY